MWRVLWLLTSSGLRNISRTGLHRGRFTNRSSVTLSAVTVERSYMAHISNLIAEDIDEYLKQHEHKSLLRFITCGSVDDGKSTLIGRLLYESKMIFEDQLSA